ncbi:MAG TPA: DUF1634 domain-containing protein [Acidimicrobiales bacterium]|nr:DUF1634 domain-containing protein [Acidimicrobiales bacterium]
MTGQETRTEVLISRLLRAGVLASVALILLGTALTFAHHPQYVTDRRAVDTLTGTHASFPHTPSAVAGGIRHGRGEAVVALGLLVLIATPVLRVALSVALFAQQRDRTFVAITAVVLGLLLVSLVLGRGAA